MDGKFWAAAFTLTGTIIGAGILGLPYVFSRAGFLIALGWLIFLGVVLTLCFLYLGEIILRTKGDYQLTGYAKKYLGTWGEKIMLFAFVFSIYGACIAYLIGTGESFSQLFTGGANYAIIFAVGFWLVMTLILKKGLEGIKKIETWGVIAIIGFVFIIFFWFMPKIKLANFSYINTSNIFLPFGVIMFALLAFMAIPEVRRIVRGKENKLKKAIIVGALIPVLLYIIFPLSFVGVFGTEVSEIATISSGPLILILGIFTMLTSYIVCAFALHNTFIYDLKFSELITFLFVPLSILILYLIITFFKLAGFISLLGIAGVINGALIGILVLLANKKAKLMGKRKPEYSLPINWFIIILLSLIFIFGVIVELMF